MPQGWGRFDKVPGVWRRGEMLGASLSACSWGHFAWIPRGVMFHHCPLSDGASLSLLLRSLWDATWSVFVPWWEKALFCVRAAEFSEQRSVDWFLIHTLVQCSSCSQKKTNLFPSILKSPCQPGRLLYCSNYPLFTYGYLNCCYPWWGLFFSLLVFLGGLKLARYWMVLYQSDGDAFMYRINAALPK